MYVSQVSNPTCYEYPALKLRMELTGIPLMVALGHVFSVLLPSLTHQQLASKIEPEKE